MQNLMQPLIQKDDSRVRLFVLDGLGGPSINGRQKLEVAQTANLGNPAVASACRTHIQATPVITPASESRYYRLFGYNSMAYPMGVAAQDTLGLRLDVKGTVVANKCDCATIKIGRLIDKHAEGAPVRSRRGDHQG